MYDKVATYGLECNVLLRDMVRNEEIPRRTGITNVIELVARLKWQWVDQIGKQRTRRWTYKVTIWRPRDTPRIGGPGWTDMETKRSTFRSGV